MLPTEKITIEVDAETARRFREADAQQRLKLELFIRLSLRGYLSPAKGLVELVEETSAEAARNGYDVVAEREMDAWLRERS